MDENSLKNISILIVDDEESICDILSEEFILFGAKTNIAKSGKEAFEILNKENFDFVITDIKMPEGDGISLIKMINEKLNYKPKIFICTGYHTLTHAEIESLGIISVLEKPFSIHEFLKIFVKKTVSS